MKDGYSKHTGTFLSFRLLGGDSISMEPVLDYRKSCYIMMGSFDCDWNGPISSRFLARNNCRHSANNRMQITAR